MLTIDNKETKLELACKNSLSGKGDFPGGLMIVRRYCGLVVIRRKRLKRDRPLNVKGYIDLLGKHRPVIVLLIFFIIFNMTKRSAITLL